MTAEKIAGGIMVVGLVLAVVGVAAPLAWYLGPFGPITHPPLLLKWLTTLCLFLCTAVLFTLGLVAHLTGWLFNIRIRLEKKIRRTKQRRAVRRQQQVA
jgi:hypothetical protein